MYFHASKILLIYSCRQVEFLHVFRSWPQFSFLRCQIIFLSVLSLHHEPLCHFIAPFLISAWHLSLRVYVTSEAVYELVAEPIQEPQAGEPRAEAAVKPGPEVANPADWQGKPRCITLSFSIQYLLYNYCAFKFLGVDWNLRCMIPRFPQSLY